MTEFEDPTPSAVGGEASFSLFLLGAFSADTVLLYLPEALFEYGQRLKRQLHGLDYTQVSTLDQLGSIKYQLIIYVDDQFYLRDSCLSAVFQELNEKLQEGGRIVYLCAKKASFLQRYVSALRRTCNITSPSVLGRWIGCAHVSEDFRLRWMGKAAAIKRNSRVSFAPNVALLGPVPISFASRKGGMSDIDRQFLGNWQDWQLVSEGTGAANNKAVFSVQSGLAAYYIKLTVGEAGCRFLANEYQALIQLRAEVSRELRDGLSLPIWYWANDAGRAVFIQKSTTLLPATTVPLIEVARWLAKIAGEFKQVTPFSEVELRQTLLEHVKKYPAGVCSKRYRRLESDLLAALITWMRSDSWDSVFLTLSHGDFVPGNVLRQPSGGVLVIDWECTNLRAVPGVDVLNYYIYSVIERSKDPVADIKVALLQPGEDILAALSRYFDALGEGRVSYFGVVLAWALQRLQVKEHMRNKNFNPEPVYILTEWLLENSALIASRWDCVAQQ